MKKSLNYLFIPCFIGLMQITSIHAEGLTTFQSFKFGLEGGYFNYQEPGLMKNEGGLFGGFGEYKLTIPDSQLFLDTLIIDGNVKAGKVDYTSNGTGEFDGNDNFVAEFRASIGKGIGLTSTTLLTPYVGIGYRYLNNDASGSITTTGHFGYERESHYLYVPIGIKAETALTPDWHVGVTTEFDLFLTGKQESHLSDISSRFNDISNDQNEGYGIRGSVEFIKKTPSYDIILEPYARWWEIDDSDISIACDAFSCFSGLEPNNETYEFGFRIGLSL